MTFTADLSGIPSVAAPETDDVVLPAPVAFDTPVLIGDCVSPLVGETVLSLLWKRLDRAAEGEE